MTVALRKKTVRVVERDADGLVVSTEETYEHDEPVAKATTDEDAALLADLRELARAEVVAKAAREAELTEEAAWVNAKRAEYAAAGRQPDPAIPGDELAVMEIEHVAAVRNPAHRMPGWLALDKSATAPAPDRVATALGKAAPPGTLGELTQERFDAMQKMTVDEWEQYLTTRVNEQPPAARASLIKGIHEMNTAGPPTPERVEAVRKAMAKGGGVIGNETCPDPTAPPITPPGVDAPNVLNGADPRYAMTTDNVERVRAVMEQHRHKASGQYRSPSRSAGEIQKAGPWAFKLGQVGATPKPTPGRIL